MPNEVYSIAFGVGLVALGIGLAIWHVRVFRKSRGDAQASERERRHDAAKFRRRLQIAALLILVGVLIPLGDVLVPWQRFQRGFAAYWMVLLLLAVWILALAILDGLSGRLQLRANRAALLAVRRKQAELELEIERLRQDHREQRGADRDDRPPVGQNGFH